jgi:hypothetical protein
VSRGSRGGAQRWAKVQGNLGHGPNAAYVERVDAEGESFRCHTVRLSMRFSRVLSGGAFDLVASVLRFVAAATQLLGQHPPLEGHGDNSCRRPRSSRVVDPGLCGLGAETLMARGVAGGTMDLPLDDLGTELPSPVSPVLNMLLQLLAWHLVRQRRIDPDQPRTIPEDHRDRQIHPDLRLSCV